jgi:hypothetical protein
VQRTKDSSPLLLLSGSGNVLCYSILLLALAATAAWGQESGLAPALFSYDQSSVRTSATAGYQTAAIPLSSVSALFLQYPMTGVQLDRLNRSVISLDASLEKSNGGYKYNWLQLVRKKSEGDGGPGFWGHLEAGYGKFFRLESGLGKNLVEWEQPSCAYLRAQFSF